MLNESELKRLGKNIKRLRKANGLSQLTLAYKAQTRPSTISELENGLNQNPGWDLLDRISAVLGTNIHELTLPQSSTYISGESQEAPAGLVELLEDQETLLSPAEKRITLQELEWLKRLPTANIDKMSGMEFLMILRQFRIFDQQLSMR